MYDLNVPERPEQRVTVWDDRFDVYKTEDIERLRDFGEVIGLSERSVLQAVLAA